MKTWINKLYVYYCVRISERAKCPACGVRRHHTIAFSPEHQRILHQCALCKATWSEAPLVQAATWAVGLRPPQSEETPLVNREPAKIVRRA